MATPLLDALAAAAPAAAAGLGAPAEAEARLAALCADAAAAWPGVEVPAAALAGAIGARLAAAEPPPLGPELARELHLALGCAAGDAAAIAAFDARYLDVVGPALAHLKLPAATVEDVRAAVRDKLLLPGPDGPARVIAYAGLGRLRGLVQVSAVRTALSLLRATGRERPLGDDGAGAAVPALDPAVDLALIRAEYRAAFTAAFGAAVAALDRRDRNLLRLHWLGGVTLEALAAMYDVHRATIVRWLAAARAAVMKGTQARLREALGGDADEVTEVIAMVGSQLDISVGRLLATIRTT